MLLAQVTEMVSIFEKFGPFMGMLVVTVVGFGVTLYFFRSDTKEVHKRHEERMDSFIKTKDQECREERKELATQFTAAIATQTERFSEALETHSSQIKEAVAELRRK